MGAARRSGAGRARQEGRADGNGIGKSRAAAGIAKLDPALSGVVEVFEDAIDDPGRTAPISRGPLPVCLS